MQRHETAHTRVTFVHFFTIRSVAAERTHAMLELLCYKLRPYLDLIEGILFCRILSRSVMFVLR